MAIGKRSDFVVLVLGVVLPWMTCPYQLHYKDVVAVAVVVAVVVAAVVGCRIMDALDVDHCPY